MMRHNWPAYIGKAVAPRGGMISSETTKNGSRAGGPESVTSHELLLRWVAVSSSLIQTPGDACRKHPSVRFDPPSLHRSGRGGQGGEGAPVALGSGLVISEPFWRTGA